MKATGTWSATTCQCFFIQDDQFPDLIHAVKPEPHNAMPQAGGATHFWDFASLMPETTHMLMWAMSDRAIPRSYATMQGFGVHAFGWSMPPVVGVYHCDPPGGHPLFGVGRSCENFSVDRTFIGVTCEGDGSRPAPTPSGEFGVGLLERQA
jgi:hypothetical protein